MRGALDGHAADDGVARLVDLLVGEPDEAKKRAPALRLVAAEAGVGLLAEHPRGEGALEIEDAGDGGFDLVEVFGVEALLREGPAVDVRRAEERVGPAHVGDDLLHLGGRITEVRQRRGAPTD